MPRGSTTLVFTRIFKWQIVGSEVLSNQVLIEHWNHPYYLERYWGEGGSICRPNPDSGSKTVRLHSKKIT